MSIQNPADVMFRNQDAVLQLALKPGTPIPLKNENTGTQPGKLFVTFAPGLAKHGYDWDNGISFKMREMEIAELYSTVEIALRYFKDECCDREISFGSEEETIKLEFDFIGNFKFTAERDELSVGPVSLNLAQMEMLKVFLACAMTRVLGW